ncbi:MULTISPECIES: helix-turn-helix domain-containing protein [unclassified Streptomyces]|uniref:helix-turn-helix domain-containing protein n=1 Tax=unclassified Streptomyces TaxID=2593676 RepID=UPI003D92CA7F
MSERTRDGLEAARARGRTGGQKPKLGPRQVKLAREMYDSGDYTVHQIADEFGVTRPTIYRTSAKSPARPQDPRNPASPPLRGYSVGFSARTTGTLSGGPAAGAPADQRGPNPQ